MLNYNANANSSQALMVNIRHLEVGVKKLPGRVLQYFLVLEIRDHAVGSSHSSSFGRASH